MSMQSTGTAILIVFLSTLVSLTDAVRADDDIRTGTQTGERFPDLTLPSLETGEMVSLSSFRGKKVLLLKFASW